MVSLKSPRLTYWPGVLVALAWLSVTLLPLNLLASQPFHHDEALYATWALPVVSGQDPWLAGTAVDKPPLFIYTLAGTFAWLGVTDTVARLPSLLATGLTVLLTFGLGRRLAGPAVGVLAAWLVALSPFTLLFAPTAFTDPLLVLLVLAGCLAALYARPAWAGFWLGLALATKQQGLLFLPLVVGLLLIAEGQLAGRSSARYGHRLKPYLARFSLVLLVTLLPVLAWDLIRGYGAGYLELSLTNYGGLFPDLVSWGERWIGFMALLWYGTASPLLTFVFLGGLPLLLLFDLWRWRHHSESLAPAGEPDERPAVFGSAGQAQATWLILLFSLAFVCLHALLTIQVWDRYLLGLMPLLALILARILLLPWSLGRACRPAWNWTAARLLVGLALAWLVGVSQAQPVQDAINGRYPLGSNSQGMAGLEQVVAYLHGQAASPQTLYHHWLGTHWRFYLSQHPYYLHYWTSPANLASRARPGQLIAFPAWQSDTEVRLALYEAGLELLPLFRAYAPTGQPTVILYRIESLSRN